MEHDPKKLVQILNREEKFIEAATAIFENMVNLDTRDLEEKVVKLSMEFMKQKADLCPQEPTSVRRRSAIQGVIKSAQELMFAARELRAARLEEQQQALEVKLAEVTELLSNLMDCLPPCTRCSLPATRRDDRHIGFCDVHAPDHTPAMLGAADIRKVVKFLGRKETP